VDSRSPRSVEPTLDSAKDLDPPAEVENVAADDAAGNDDGVSVSVDDEVALNVPGDLHPCACDDNERVGHDAVYLCVA